MLFQKPPRKTRSGEGQARAPDRTTRHERSTGADAKCSRARRGRSRTALGGALLLSWLSPVASGRASRAGGCGSDARSLRAIAAARPAAERSRGRARIRSSAGSLFCVGGAGGADPPRMWRSVFATLRAVHGRRGPACVHRQCGAAGPAPESRDQWRESSVDGAAQDTAVAVAESLVARDGAVRSLADPVRIAIVNEAALEDRPAYGAER